MTAPSHDAQSRKHGDIAPSGQQAREHGRIAGGRVLRKKVERDLDRNILKIHEMTIDPARCEVLLAGRPVTLTFSEFNILYTLAKRPGVVFTRYQIVDSLHGSDHIVTERAVDVQIARL